MKRLLTGAFLSGLLFAIGLCLAEMTNPARVIGFLDFFGRWDPTLAFVMMGAVATYSLLSRLITRLRAPLFAPKFAVPARNEIDRKLIIGSSLFGVGWGLAGYCPGPVVTSLASGSGAAFVFTGGMLAGFAGYAWWTRSSSQR